MLQAHIVTSVLAADQKPGHHRTSALRMISRNHSLVLHSSRELEHSDTFERFVCPDPR